MVHFPRRPRKFRTREFSHGSEHFALFQRETAGPPARSSSLFCRASSLRCTTTPLTNLDSPMNMETLAPAKMTRQYQRRSPDQKIADLQRKITELQARREARAKKSDPVLKDALKLHRRLKAFIKLALDHRRPDVANSAMGFKANLERLVAEAEGAPSLDDEDDVKEE